MYPAASPFRLATSSTVIDRTSSRMFLPKSGRPAPARPAAPRPAWRSARSLVDAAPAEVAQGELDEALVDRVEPLGVDGREGLVEVAVQRQLGPYEATSRSQLSAASRTSLSGCSRWPTGPSAQPRSRGARRGRCRAARCYRRCGWPAWRRWPAAWPWRRRARSCKSARNSSALVGAGFAMGDGDGDGVGEGVEIGLVFRHVALGNGGAGGLAAAAGSSGQDGHRHEARSAHGGLLRVSVSSSPGPNNLQGGMDSERVSSRIPRMAERYPMTPRATRR